MHHPRPDGRVIRSWKAKESTQSGVVIVDQVVGGCQYLLEEDFVGGFQGEGSSLSGSAGLSWLTIWPQAVGIFFPRVEACDLYYAIPPD